MTTDFELGEVIARRVIGVEGDDREVQVLIGRPRPVAGGGYVCGFQVLGLGDDRVVPAPGADGLHALQRAMKMVAGVLHTSEEHRHGLLSWNDDIDLGFEPFTPRTTQLGRSPGNENELRELLCTATRVVSDFTSGRMPLRDFVAAYGRVYHWADLEGRVAAEERRILDAYADVIALHRTLRPLFAAASSGSDAWVPALPPEPEQPALEQRIRNAAEGIDLRQWIIELSRPAPKVH